MKGTRWSVTSVSISRTTAGSENTQLACEQSKQSCLYDRASRSRQQLSSNTRFKYLELRSKFEDLIARHEVARATYRVCDSIIQLARFQIKIRPFVSLFVNKKI